VGDGIARRALEVVAAHREISGCARAAVAVFTDVLSRVEAVAVAADGVVDAPALARVFGAGAKTHRAVAVTHARLAALPAAVAAAEAVSTRRDGEVRIELPANARIAPGTGIEARIAHLGADFFAARVPRAHLSGGGETIGVRVARGAETAPHAEGQLCAARVGNRVAEETRGAIGVRRAARRAVGVRVPDARAETAEACPGVALVVVRAVRVVPALRLGRRRECAIVAERLS